MIVKQAKFVCSSSKSEQRPKPRLAEFAFVGRSNVGKSSLINMLCNNQKLALTSAKPGKTKLINHFLVNEQWYLVDLPGYGYAKVSKSEKIVLSKLIEEYLNDSIELVNLFVLIDSRHELQKLDLQFLLKLGEAGVPFSIIYTKADKLSTSELNKNIDSLNNSIMEYWEEMPTYFISSSEDKRGKDEILKYIGSLINIKN